MHMHVYNPKIQQSTSTGCTCHIMRVDQDKATMRSNNRACMFQMQSKNEMHKCRTE